MRSRCSPRRWTRTRLPPALTGSCVSSTAGRPVRAGNRRASYRERLRLVNGRIERCPAGAPTTFGALILLDILLTPGNLVARREVVDRLGGVDPLLLANGHWDFALRLAATGYLAFVDRPVLRYRKHGAGMSLAADATESFARERATIMRKLVESPDVSEEQRRLVRLADTRLDELESGIAALSARASVRDRHWAPAARDAQLAVVKWLKSLVRPLLSRFGLMQTRRVL